MANFNQTINGYRVDSRDKRSVKQSKELDYLNPRKGSQEALEALHDAIDEDNKLEKPERNCHGKEALFRDYDSPKNLGGAPTDFEARVMCWGCPLFDLCSDYADKGHPAWGVWAGKVYGRNLMFDEEEM